MRVSIPRALPHPLALEKKLSLLRLGGPLHYRDPKQRSIDGYRERFWCIVQPRSMASDGFSRQFN